MRLLALPLGGMRLRGVRIPPPFAMVVMVVLVVVGFSGKNHAGRGKAPQRPDEKNNVDKDSPPPAAGNGKSRAKDFGWDRF